MVFELSAEQQDFQNSLRRFFERESDAACVRRAIDNPKQNHTQLINGFRALGLSEVYADADSASESFVELLLVASECGRALCPYPVLEGLAAGPLFFSLFVSDSSKKKIDVVFGAGTSAEIVAEKKIVVRAPLYTRSAVLEVSPKGEELYVSGELRLIPKVEQMQFIIGREGDAVLLVDARAAKCSDETSLDITQRRVRVALADARAVKIELERREVYDALSYALICSEVLGACRKAFEMTAEYVKTRKQFETPIGTFQAVQHALADMYLKLEMIDSMVSFLGWTLSRSPNQRALSSEAAMRLVLRDSASIVEKAIQLHGGIGFTWEHDLHLYLRRVRTLCALVGDISVYDEALLRRLATAAP